jgi:hypothetical protein
VINPHPREKRITVGGEKMKRLLLPALLLCVIVGLIYLQFGSITPCGILKKRMKAKIVEDMATKNDLTLLVAATLGNSAVDNMIEALTPMQCLQRLRQS